MKIGVVADTHSKKLPKQMLEDFKEVDLILHAGDIVSLGDLEVFKKIKDVKAVYGNMDDAKLRHLLPRKQIIACGKFSIGLTHGEGGPQMLLEKVRETFQDSNVQAIVFGHSHQPVNKWIDGILFFNPGSPNDTVYAPYQSYGILEVTDKISGQIIKVRS